MPCIRIDQYHRITEIFETLSDLQDSRPTEAVNVEIHARLLTTPVATALVKTFYFCSSLRWGSLKLDNCVVNKQANRVLAEACASDIFERLAICFSSMPLTYAEALKLALRGEALKTLELTAVSIGSEAAQCLSEGLRESTSLVNLDLFKVNSPRGHPNPLVTPAVHLAYGLKHNISLTSFRFFESEHCMFNDLELSLILGALVGHPALTQIVFEHTCFFEDECLKALEKILSSSVCKLRDLDIADRLDDGRDWIPTQADSNMLRSAVLRCSSLRDLKLHAYFFRGRADMKLMLDIVRTRPNLQISCDYNCSQGENKAMLELTNYNRFGLLIFEQQDLQVPTPLWPLVLARVNRTIEETYSHWVAEAKVGEKAKGIYTVLQRMAPSLGGIPRGQPPHAAGTTVLRRPAGNRKPKRKRLAPNQGPITTKEAYDDICLI